MEHHCTHMDKGALRLIYGFLALSARAGKRH